jgi:uncharacterized protein YbjT (DUF2867 family)
LSASFVVGAEALMNKHTYAVTISTGRIGNRVARGLLDAGHDVRAIGRDTARLGDLSARGARPFVGDIRDPAFVEKAFDGADAAFLFCHRFIQSVRFRCG